MAVLGTSKISDLIVTNTKGAQVGDVETGDLLVEGGASVKGNLNVGNTVYAQTYNNLPVATITNEGGITKLYDQVGSEQDGAITPNGVRKLQDTINSNISDLSNTVINNYNTLNTKIDTEVSTLTTKIDTDISNLNTVINQRIDSEVADLENQIANIQIEPADEDTQGITYLYNEANATDQDDGAITPKAVDTKIETALENYTPSDEAVQAIIRTWRSSIRTSTEGTASIQIENYTTDMQVMAFINGMALSAAEPKIEYTLSDTGLVTTTNSLLSNQDFMVIALYNEIISVPKEEVNNTFNSWRQTITSSGDTTQILSIQIPNYNAETMEVLAYLNGFTLSDGTNSDLVEYTVSDTGLVSTTNVYPADQDFMVIVFYYGDSSSQEEVVSSPSISVSGTTLTITCEDPAATIYYAINNSDPATNGSIYSGPVTLTQSGTIYAVATKSGSTNSAVVSYSYTQPQVATPMISYSVNTGSFTLSCDTAGASIKYSLNNSDPLNNGTTYNNAAVTITDSPTTVYAIATLANYANSEIANAVCQLKVATPVITIV